MKMVRPDNPEPIPGRDTRPQMGRIILRFVALLVIIIGLMFLAWSR